MGSKNKGVSFPLVGYAQNFLMLQVALLSLMFILKLCGLSCKTNKQKQSQPQSLKHIYSFVLGYIHSCSGAHMARGPCTDYTC